MPPEDVLSARPGRDVRRLELSDHLPSTNDDERLATVLDRIEQVREASRCFCRGDLRHEVRLSEMTRRGYASRPDRGSSALRPLRRPGSFHLGPRAEDLKDPGGVEVEFQVPELASTEQDTLALVLGKPLRVLDNERVVESVVLVDVAVCLLPAEGTDHPICTVPQQRLGAGIEANGA
jgi:hypothetical protein